LAAAERVGVSIGEFGGQSDVFQQFCDPAVLECLGHEFVDFQALGEGLSDGAKRI
jgi:hypothetical protein